MPGLLSIAIIFLIALRAQAGLITAVMAALLFAVNGEFIEYSNQLKPYMFEVLIHLICVLAWLILVTAEHITIKKITIFFLTLIFAIFASANSVFLLPAITVSVMLWVMLLRPINTRTIIYFSVGFALIALFTGLMYLFFWSYGNDKGLVAYWSDGFYGTNNLSYIHFLVNAFSGMWMGGFNAFSTNHAMPRAALFIFILTLPYLILSFKKNTHNRQKKLLILTACFFIVFFITVIALNSLGLWPIGRLRPNQFIYAQLVIVFTLMLSCIPNVKLKNIFASIIILISLIRILQISTLELSDLSPPRQETDLAFSGLKQALKGEILVEQTCLEQKKSVVLLNPGASSAYQYFSTEDSGASVFRATMPQCILFLDIPYLSPSSENVIIALDRYFLEKRNLWLVYSHLSDDEIYALHQLLLTRTNFVLHTPFIGAGYFKIGR